MRWPFLLRRIRGLSMWPTFTNGQVVVAWRTNSNIQVGDVIFAEVDGREVIKRVAAITGSKLRLIGDNPEFSTDSRHYGSVDMACVCGKVIWPTDVSQKS